MKLFQVVKLLLFCTIAVPTIRGDEDYCGVKAGVPVKACPCDCKKTPKEIESASGSCTSQGSSVKCCGSVSFNLIFKRVDLSACVYAEYIPDDLAVRVKLEVLGDTIVDQTVSVQDPPDFCAPIPEIEVVSACLKVSDLKISDGFSCCFAIEFKALDETVATIDLGCI